MTTARKPTTQAVPEPIDGYPALDTVLDRRGCRDALVLFRSGLDNVDIAWQLECTPAAAANGIARARDEERRAAA